MTFCSITFKPSCTAWLVSCMVSKNFCEMSWKAIYIKRTFMFPHRKTPLLHFNYLNNLYPMTFCVIFFLVSHYCAIYKYMVFEPHTLLDSCLVWCKRTSATIQKVVFIIIHIYTNPYIIHYHSCYNTLHIIHGIYMFIYILVCLSPVQVQAYVVCSLQLWISSTIPSPICHFIYKYGL